MTNEWIVSSRAPFKVHTSELRDQLPLPKASPIFSGLPTRSISLASLLIPILFLSSSLISPQILVVSSKSGRKTTICGLVIWQHGKWRKVDVLSVLCQNLFVIIKSLILHDKTGSEVSRVLHPLWLDKSIHHTRSSSRRLEGELARWRSWGWNPVCPCSRMISFDCVSCNKLSIDRSWAWHTSSSVRCLLASKLDHLGCRGSSGAVRASYLLLPVFARYWLVAQYVSYPRIVFHLWTLCLWGRNSSYQLQSQQRKSKAMW